MLSMPSQPAVYLVTHTGESRTVTCNRDLANTACVVTTRDGDAGWADAVSIVNGRFVRLAPAVAFSGTPKATPFEGGVRITGHLPGSTSWVTYLVTRTVLARTGCLSGGEMPTATLSGGCTGSGSGSGSGVGRQTSRHGALIRQSEP